MLSVSFSGGLDVDGIVRQLMFVERAPLRALERAREALAAEKGALEAFRARLGDLRASAGAIRGPTALAPRTATSADEGAVRASAAPGTQVGTYAVEVTQLAATNAHASAGFDLPDTALPHGTFDLRIGATTVTIDVGEGSDTLETLRDAIAASGAEVQALVLYDGSQYRLSLTSKQSGEAGRVTIENFSSSDLESALSFTETSPARDALFSVNGLDLVRSSNHVPDVVEGLTLDLLDETTGEVGVTVAADLDQAVAAIRKFVEDYNALVSYIRSQLAGEGRESGPLAALSSVRALQDKLRELVSRSVPGLEADVRNLRQVGLELQNDGSLVVDESALSQALEDGTVPDLFALGGRTSDARARFALGTRDTQAGTYEVVVTRAAERASVTGTKKIQGSGLGQDEVLTFTEGTESVEVFLTKGQSLSEVIDTINDTLAGTGIDVRASDDGDDHLVLTSVGYGSAATVDVVSDTDANKSTGIGTAGLSDAGVDVAGTIGGLAASGSGRLLTATEGDAKGLVVEVRATADEVDPSGTSLGDVTVSLGVA
jgi:flagellar hook-associated protein 2